MDYFNLFRECSLAHLSFSFMNLRSHFKSLFHSLCLSFFLFSLCARVRIWIKQANDWHFISIFPLVFFLLSDNCIHRKIGLSKLRLDFGWMCLTRRLFFPSTSFSRKQGRFTKHWINWTQYSHQIQIVSFRRESCKIFYLFLPTKQYNFLNEGSRFKPIYYPSSSSSLVIITIMKAF